MKLTKVFLTALTLLAISAHSQAETQTLVITDFTQPKEWDVSKWNTAEGRIALRPNVPPALKAATPPVTESLGMKINWPGGEGFRVFSLQPRNEIQLPSGVTEIRLWLDGSGTKHFCELILKDANGKRQKIGIAMLTDDGWKQFKKNVAPNLQQPLTLTAISFHDWGNPTPGEITTYLSQLEVVVDSSAPQTNTSTASKDQW
ncbi:hypothetical protein [Cerasicoccus frondis]|uniref:hypothetical protein n=1 Tax=Cerasicoccus frondis TaxID=490090 RepID=UPI0028527CCA|nr:hypothetical protein [Cerasicoccus frondis]